MKSAINSFCTTTRLFVLLGLLAQKATLSFGDGYTEEGQALIQGIQNLAENKNARGSDYKNAIQETIIFGNNPNAANRFYSSLREDPQGQAQAEWQKFIDDSFSILDEGERRDPKDSAWPKLREELAKLRPPAGADSKPQTDKKKQKKDQKKDKKEQKKSGKDKQPQPKSGGGQKSDQQDGGEGKEGEGESEGQPSQGQPGKGNKKGGQEGGEEEGSGEGGSQGKEQQSRGKDPNEVRDFSNSKDGEGEMKQRGRNEDMKGMEDEKAGFGSLGARNEKGKEKKEAGGTGAAMDGKEGEPSAPAGMRVVGGGTGQKGNEKTSDPLTLEALSRLDQVKQSDSPAVLQQRLQPQDQRPQPSSMGKPW
jgi:hypothetical protein